MSTKNLSELYSMSNKLENEHNRIFKNQNELNKKIERLNLFGKLNNSTKFENHLSDFFKSYDLINKNSNLSKIVELTDTWNNKVSNNLKKSFKINEYFLNFQKDNTYILDLINNRDFIENYLEKYNDATEEDTAQQDANLNLFGEMINYDIAADDSQLAASQKIDFRKLALGIQYLLYAVFTLYITHLDEFDDIHEAFVFYINNIECKGITISRIHLRSAPSFDSEIIVPIPNGSALIVYEETSNGWVKVKININNIDLEGYVSNAYIKRINK